MWQWSLYNLYIYIYIFIYIIYNLKWANIMGNQQHETTFRIDSLLPGGVLLSEDPYHQRRGASGVTGIASTCPHLSRELVRLAFHISTLFDLSILSWLHFLNSTMLNLRLSSWRSSWSGSQRLPAGCWWQHSRALAFGSTPACPSPQTRTRGSTCCWQSLDDGIFAH